MLLGLLFSATAIGNHPLPAAAGQSMTEELSVDPVERNDGYSAVLYDNTNGLPTSEANAILQTSDGFIWIGSYSGLIRYDGCNFERYDSTTGIASVMSLYEDSRCRLWVGTNDSGAAFIAQDTSRMYNRTDGLKSLSVRSITEDPDGNVFLATTNGLAYVDSADTLHILEDPRISEEYIWHIRTASDGTIYGVTVNGAVFTVRNCEITGFYDADALGISEVYDVLPDPKNPGYVYLGTSGSEIYYGALSADFSAKTTYNTAPLKYINSLAAAGDMVWACSGTGIGVLNNGKITVIQNTPLDTSVENMMVDYQGNLWFASSKQGVMKIVPNQFTDVFDRSALENTVVESTCLYHDKLLIGTKNSGLTVLQSNHAVKHIPVTESVSASGKSYNDTNLLDLMNGTRIRHIFQDSKDRLWLATFSELGLVCYDDGKVTRFTQDDGMPSNRIRNISECADGSLIAGCSGGLVVIRDGKIAKVYTDADGIKNTELLSTAQDSSGNLVIGTDGGGMYLLQDGTFTHFDTGNSGLSSDVVMRIKPDRFRDLLWIITSNSIGYMKPDGEIITIQKFPYSNNFDLYENKDGKMWVLSSNGIYVADVENLLNNGEISCIHINRDNGLPCTATPNSYSALSDSGELYIAGTSGVSSVNIDAPYENINNTRISVPYLETDGSRVYPDDAGHFTIPASVKHLTVYGFVYNYSLLNPNVTYRLDGFEQDSQTVLRSELTPITYTNLNGGNYTFIMRIDDPLGQSSQEYQVVIEKQKAFFELLWVRVLIWLMMLVIPAAIVKLLTDHRARILQQRAEAQKQFSYEMVKAFSKLIDMKDSYTNGHSSRVADYTKMLCKELGLDDETIDRYYCIALLHDIGKIGIPPEVLNKPGKLTDTEFNIIKSHSALGYETLKGINIMPELAVGAGAHHERPDGRGYPKGLKGDEIPRVAQIIAVADTFDAMYSDRPYRKRMNFDKVVSIMREVRGTQLAEDVVDAFLRLVDKGEFRSPDDHGGGSTEDIDNIHRKQKSKEKTPES